MKCQLAALSILVTPFAGVWIEIAGIIRISHPRIVTPFAGVWIEIVISFVF